MTTISLPQTQNLNFRIFSEAQEAMIKLLTLKPLLSSQDEETLAILMDKKLSKTLEKSLCEAKTDQLEPLSSILE